MSPSASWEWKPVGSRCSRDRLQNIIGMAGAVIRPAADNPAARDVPVTIRDGVARIGFIPLGTIPRLGL